MDALQDEVPVVVDIFESLWRAQAHIHIPETIVYRYGKLESWYFNAIGSRSGEAPLVKRKRNFTIWRGDVVERICTLFCSGAKHKDDVVGTFVQGEPGADCQVLHLTASSLEKFMKHVPDKGHGVLQRWVPPFGGHAALLRTDWSPHFFGLDMRVNWHSVHGGHFVTFGHSAACTHAGGRISGP